MRNAILLNPDTPTLWSTRELRALETGRAQHLGKYIAITAIIIDFLFCHVNDIPVGDAFRYSQLSRTFKTFNRIAMLDYFGSIRKGKILGAKCIFLHILYIDSHRNLIIITVIVNMIHVLIWIKCICFKKLNFLFDNEMWY